MRNVLLAIAAVLLGCLVFALWPDGSAAEVVSVTSGSGSATGADPGAGVTATVTRSAAERVKPTASVERRENVTSDEVTAGLAILKGRCVDAGGVPLAGVSVRVHGWGANSARMDQHRKAHGEVVWTDPEPRVTGVDGRFEFAFAPPPPYQFTIDIKHDGRLSMTGRWGGIPPGTVKDFGDVRMRGGCVVRGRLLDSKSLPVAEARIGINQFANRAQSRRAEIHPRDHMSCTTAADGSFEFAVVVPPGEYRLGIGRREIVSPQPFVVPGEQSGWYVDIVVKSLADIPTIEGIVVDASGDPVPRVDIRSTETPFWYRDSRRDGTFTVRRSKRDTGAPVRLVFRKDGFEEGKTDKALEWGTKNVRVVMKRGLDVELHVTDGDENKPLEDYSVIVLATPGKWNRSSSLDHRPRNRGHHAHGVTVLRGLKRGSYRILVDPKGDDWLHSRFHALVVGGEGVQRLDVVVHRGIPCTVRVESSQGTPIVGTRLELVHRVGTSRVSFETWVMRLNSGAHSSSPDVALFRAEAKTDRDGKVVFIAPPGSDYVVRAHGPGHRPHIEPHVAFAAGGGPLILRVSAGARVFGRVRPPKLFDQLREESKSSARDGKYGVGFRLRRRTPAGRYERFPEEHALRFKIREDGSYEIAGIPPGSWQVRLHWGMNENEFIGEWRGLEDGEVRELDLDLARMVLAEVHGRVTMNGKPASGSTLTFRANGTENARWKNYRLDEDGRFRAMVVPDTYQMILQHKVGDRRSVMLPAASELHVRPGRESEHDIAFRGSALRIVVVGMDGKPRRGVQVHASDPNSDWGTTLPLTDDEGRADTVTKLVGLHLYVWPKHLMSREARRAFSAKHRGETGAWKRQRIKVGEARVTAGAGTEVRVQLPESAGY